MNEKLDSKRKFIDWALLIFWMVFIFYMSNQPAKVSDAQSGTVITILTTLGININGIFGELANFIVRKCAHFLEYMILAFFCFNVMRYYFEIRRNSLISILFVFIYACSDEFHQLFVAGREGAFRDVAIDTSGGITLILIILIIKYIKLKKQNKKI